MAQDSESRLKKIMEKLYHAPRPVLSALSRKRECEGVILNRRSPVGTLASRGSVEKTVFCRPWDRSDLIRRLATFKAMTWFGKPKVISPLNCARRGWINLEMDVLVCQACEARLLFSTPPSWSLQQVEKAAAVFSLKLNNGHKLLCPWIDKACDESLTLFQPSPPQVLVEGFKGRYYALSSLTSLPVISSLAIDCMKNPQFDRFLFAQFHPSIALDNVIRLVDDCGNKDLQDATEDGSSHSYCKAQKIISLCGWEPRLLPYTIEFDDKCAPSAKAANLLESTKEVPCEPTQNATNSSFIVHNDAADQKDPCALLGEYHHDQSSTVFECKFCGACVGLWLFKSIPRPLEFFKIIVDSSHQIELTPGTSDLSHSLELQRFENVCRGDHNSSIERPIGGQLTIAGGPTPTKQHFRPKISLPAVSRHLRADLSYNLCSSYQGSLGRDGYTCQDKEFKGQHDIESEAVEFSKHKRIEAENSSSQLQLEENHGFIGNIVARETGSESIPEETLHSLCIDAIATDAVACEDGSVIKPTDARDSNDFSLSLNKSNCGGTSENAGDNGPCLQTDGVSAGKQGLAEFANKVSFLITHEETDHLSGNWKSVQLRDFDPIKQHRPFCPWIFDEGKNLPGWKVTLSAIDNAVTNFSQQTEQTEAASCFCFDQADDPIVSVRKLFTSPSSKRVKRGLHWCNR